MTHVRDVEWLLGPVTIVARDVKRGCKNLKSPNFRFLGLKNLKTSQI